MRKATGHSRARDIGLSSLDAPPPEPRIDACPADQITHLKYQNRLSIPPKASVLQHVLLQIGSITLRLANADRRPYTILGGLEEGMCG